MFVNHHEESAFLRIFQKNQCIKTRNNLIANKILKIKDLNWKDIKTKKPFLFISAIQQAVPVVLDQGFASMAFFIIGALCARAVDKDTYSIYVLGNSIILIIIGFERALITTPFAILSPGKKDSEESYYLGDMCIFHGFFIAATLFLFIGLGIFWQIKQGVFADNTVAWAVLFSTIGQSFYYFLKYILLARMQNTWNLIFGVTCNSVIVFSIISLYLLNILDVKSMFMVVGGVSLLLSCGFYFPLLKETIFRFECIQTNMKKHWSIGKWIVGSNIAFIFSSQMFPWLLAYFSTKEAVANFGVAMGVTRIFTPLTQGIASFLLPKLSHIQNTEVSFSKAVKVTTILAGVLSGILLIVGFFWGEFLCTLLYSKKYSGLGLLIFLSFVIQGLNIINIPIDAALNALKRTDLGFKSLVLSSILATFVGLPLTKEYGVMGACVGSIVAVLGGVIYRAFYLHAMMKRINQ